MLVKRSQKNQIAIPKAVLERAGLSNQDVYFDISYEEGRIVLTPVEIEEKISPEALARFEEKASKQEPGDRSYRSMEELIRGLHRSPRRKSR